MVISPPPLMFLPLTTIQNLPHSKVHLTCIGSGNQLRWRLSWALQAKKAASLLFPPSVLNMPREHGNSKGVCWWKFKRYQETQQIWLILTVILSQAQNFFLLQVYVWLILVVRCSPFYLMDNADLYCDQHCNAGKGTHHNDCKNIPWIWDFLNLYMITWTWKCVAVS